jgi:DNA-binding transcriptional LysR family regulator
MKVFRKTFEKALPIWPFLLTESFQTADLEAEVLGIETLILVTHPDHPLVKEPKVHTKNLKGETLLFSKMDCSYRRTVEATFNMEKIRFDNTLEFNSVEAIKQCVMAGVGITILPEITVAKDISEGRLAAISWDEGALEVAALMIWYKDRWLSPTLNAFMETVRNVVKKEYDKKTI